VVDWSRYQNFPRSGRSITASSSALAAFLVYLEYDFRPQFMSEGVGNDWM